MNAPIAISGARYRAEEPLSRRGPIETWRGRDLTLERPVTVRVVRPDDEVATRLKSQLRTLARLEHPGLLHVLDTCIVGEGFAIVTEELPALRLRDELDLNASLSPPRAVDVAQQVAAALQVLHDHGFAHGDINPEAIGVRNDATCVLLDGPPTSDSLSIPATVRGDIRALGQLLHLLLLGSPPRRSLDGQLEVLPGLPPTLHDAIDRAITDDPVEQWADVASLSLALSDQPIPEVLVAPPEGFLESQRAWLTPTLAVLAIAAVLVVAGLLVRQTTVGRVILDNAREAVGIDVASSPGSGTVGSADATESIARSIDSATIVAITDFDPEGDDREEHPERLLFINDGNQTQGWHTSRYNSAEFGGLKRGVGLIVELESAQIISDVRVDSETLGWGLEIYASLDAPGDLADWGAPVTARSDIDGAARLVLNDVPATTLLIWIINLGEERDAGGHRTTITNIEVLGRPDRG